MKRGIALLAAIIIVSGARSAVAQTQESAPGPGIFEVTIIPGGGTFFTEASDSNSPSFGNYDLGGSATLNFNRYVGVEGEVSGLLGVSQSLDFVTGTADVKTPHFLNYSGNLVLSAGRGSVVPYATAGLGGLSLFERAEVGINDTTTFLTGNVGGGVKWYAGRWGLRGDYRFIAVQSKEDAPAFFGTETRYGHRVYGGVILNVVR
jgi:Outer membrane protein beta-barrel domain